MASENQKVTTQTAAISNGAELAPLRSKAGAIQRIGTKFSTSAAAGRALREVEKYEVGHEARIAETAIELSAARIRTALVATTMPAIGALAVSLNNATAGVDMALTNGAAGEVASHIDNRRRNLALADELHTSGHLSDDEKAVLIGFAETDAAIDVERSRKRMADGKNAVETLHGYALSGIEKAKAGLDR